MGHTQGLRTRELGARSAEAPPFLGGRNVKILRALLSAAWLIREGRLPSRLASERPARQSLCLRLLPWVCRTWPAAENKENLSLQMLPASRASSLRGLLMPLLPLLLLPLSCCCGCCFCGQAAGLTVRHCSQLASHRSPRASELSPFPELFWLPANLGLLLSSTLLH